MHGFCCSNPTSLKSCKRSRTTFKPQRNFATLRNHYTQLSPKRYRQISLMASKRREEEENNWSLDLSLSTLRNMPVSRSIQECSVFMRKISTFSEEAIPLLRPPAQRLPAQSTPFQPLTPRYLRRSALLECPNGSTPQIPHFTFTAHGWKSFAGPFNTLCINKQIEMSRRIPVAASRDFPVALGRLVNGFTGCERYLDGVVT
jgi:hypothetical protein